MEAVEKNTFSYFPVRILFSILFVVLFLLQQIERENELLGRAIWREKERDFDRERVKTTRTIYKVATRKSDFKNNKKNSLFPSLSQFPRALSLSLPLSLSFCLPSHLRASCSGPP